MEPRRIKIEQELEGDTKKEHLPIKTDSAINKEQRRIVRATDLLSRRRSTLVRGRYTIVGLGEEHKLFNESMNST